jgi:DNA-binding NarL/FixJ family response regulator
MDLRMPGVDGLAAIERITKLADPPAVVALTTFNADQHVLRALRAGARRLSGQVDPAGEPDRAGARSRPRQHRGLAGRRAAAGRSVGRPASTRQRARELAQSLTERELEVLACLGEGLSNAQIAARLYLSEATVKGYVSRMLVKLGCTNRTQAGLLAHDAGIVK